MKKYFPILAFITMFTGFLAGQVFFDVFESSAGQSSSQKKIYSHYEDLLRESVFVTEKSKSIAGNAIEAPVAVSYTHLRAHETDSYLVCRLLLEKTLGPCFSDSRADQHRSFSISI